MAEGDKKPEDSEVGYGKPPKKSQFKPGQSGNLAGRRKGTPNLATALDRALNELVVVNDRGQHRKMSKLEAMVITMVNTAAQGDIRARQQVLQQIIRFLEGKSAEALNDAELAQEDKEIMKRAVARMQAPAKEDDDDDPDFT